MFQLLKRIVYWYIVQHDVANHCAHGRGLGRFIWLLPYPHNPLPKTQLSLQRPLLESCFMPDQRFWTSPRSYGFRGIKTRCFTPHPFPPPRLATTHASSSGIPFIYIREIREMHTFFNHRTKLTRFAIRFPSLLVHHCEKLLRLPLSNVLYTVRDIRQRDPRENEKNSSYWQIKIKK